MRTIHLSSGNFALVDDEDFDNLKHFTWFEHKGYVARTINYTYGGKKRTKYVSMHRSIMKTPKWLCVDHIDHNTLNNQKYNLRNCSIGENNKNQRMQKNNTVGYKGVYFEKCSGKFKAQIGQKGGRKNLGRFKTALEAAKAYNVAALKDFGEFAKLNEIPA